MSSAEHKLALLTAASDRFTALTSALSADQLRATSYDDEWSNAQVASHLGSGAEIFGLLLEAGRRGEPTPPNEEWQRIWARWNDLGPEDQIAQSARTRAAFVTAVEGLDPAERDRFAVEAFNRRLDLADLIGMRLTEQTVHAWDVAVGSDATATLAPDGVAELIDEVGALAAWLPPVPGLAPVEVITTDPDRRFRLTFEPTRRVETLDGAASDRSDASDRGDGDEPLVLPAEAFIRLLYGRLDADHASAVPADDRLAALRAAFPGF